MSGAIQRGCAGVTKGQVKAAKATRVTVTNFEFYDCLREDAQQGETCWTVSKHALRGDKMLLYVCAPVSSVVAVATLGTDAEECVDPNNEWFGHHFADMHGLTMLARPLTRAELMGRFPEWKFWRQPRTGCRVPERFVPELDELLSAASKTAPAYA